MLWLRCCSGWVPIHRSGSPAGGVGIVAVTDSICALRCVAVRARAATQRLRSGVPAR